MPVYIALLRAVNVGGTGRLPMNDLKSLCTDAGFESVETYIASGNVVFKSSKKPVKVKDELEAQLADYAGKPVGVQIRTASELKSIVDANPYSSEEPSKTVAIFLDRKVNQSDISDISGANDEELASGKREIYVHYPGGIGVSKLKITAAKAGTARNFNTLRKLLTMAEKAQTS